MLGRVGEIGSKIGSKRCEDFTTAFAQGYWRARERNFGGGAPRPDDPEHKGPNRTEHAGALFATGYLLYVNRSGQLPNVKSRASIETRRLLSCISSSVLGEDMSDAENILRARFVAGFR